MTAHLKKIENVLRLDAQSRCEYFIRKVADFEVVWSLFDQGWATARTGATTVLPFWPEEAFAKLCATDEWQGFRPKAIALDDFLERWLPGMAPDQRICAVFAAPSDRGTLMAPMDLERLIRMELEQYE
ncbi:DUF2750 domain-containing protein [Burkholderia ambifaria]|uniref:DUF2750 domain-containing protein n=1 Tax=Burkholderia ambifaria MEX-5 TaxID=396597 RepID=B1T005_9BURK|nr:DUF2750 domain-containing protein [Burkholderia ambifaria]EDT43095.1 conserved hypothetical protein [Burkholderia ambifaria MEX-5]